MMKNPMSRRAFFGVGASAAAVAAAAGITGCAPKASENKSAASTENTSGASFLDTPEPITDIAETKECDILIIGSALSGLCAARAAVENGAENVIVVEKAETWQYRSNQFGTIGGKIQRDLGIEIDKTPLSASS